MCARGDYEPARERAGVFRGELSVLQVLLAGAWCVRPAWTQLHLKLHTQLVAWISIICGREAPPFFLEFMRTLCNVSFAGGGGGFLVGSDY